MTKLSDVPRHGSAKIFDKYWDFGGGFMTRVNGSLKMHMYLREVPKYYKGSAFDTEQLL